ncbi:F-box domain protein [Aspergillus alliaceus]|uniref:F-box domain protein n=1 Tax=Petromyces alliaceus TaxID=209559 RepID=A0A5N7BQB0_PETAA|nr:F-box domain protein [Aspergillus alliaceus]
MHPHEWRDVRDRMTQVSFQKDILGNLPMEIAVQIAKYFDLAEFHLFRRVSKRWNHLLSSTLFRGAVFHRYTGHICSSIATESPDAFTQYAKQRVRLERGQPVSQIYNSPCLPLPSPTGSAGLDFSNGRYAWIEDAVVHVHSLHSSTTRSFCTENRDSFTTLRVSESIVAGITLHGFCHVWCLKSSDSAHFRLPSLQWKYFVVRGVNVAMAFSGMTSEKDFIIHWHFDSRVARTFNIANKLAYIDVNPYTGTLITVHLEENVGSNISAHTRFCPAVFAQLQVIKYPLKDFSGGARPSSYTITLPSIAVPTSLVEIDANLSFEIGNTMGILSVRPEGCLAETAHGIVAIIYNPETDKVNVNIVCSENSPFMPLCMTSIGDNILYYIKNDNGKPKIWISNPDAAIPHRPAKCMSPQLPREASNRVCSYGTNFTLRGDGDFILMIDQNRLKVWCFDDNIYLPGAVPLERT